MKIKRLKLYSKNLDKQKFFYSELLGLNLLNEHSQSYSVQIGNSILEFHASENATPYHFAINIPSNKENEALAWLKERVTILTGKGEEIHDFDFWNAKAIYFYDEDENIVEFIARKNLKNESSVTFSNRSLLSIIEIGMPTTGIPSIYKLMNDKTGLAIFSGDLEQFCALGDEEGLLICIAKNSRDWYPANDKAYSSNFEVDLEIEKKSYQLRFLDDLCVVSTI